MAAHSRTNASDDSTNISWLESRISLFLSLHEVDRGCGVSNSRTECVQVNASLT